MNYFVLLWAKARKMILVFGGTTEGRRAIDMLEEAGSPYFYSTKTGEQEMTLHNGTLLSGAMDAERMTTFCREQGIRLIVDAAHPFASVLHQTIAETAENLHIPVIRYERIYPPRDPDITWINEYSEVPTDITTLLATTGVQSISKLKWLEQRGVKVYYRILNRPSSIALAKAQGANDSQLYYYDEKESSHLSPLTSHLLLKESGLSGGFVEKVEEARRTGMRIIALRRPAMPESFITVNGPYGLRRMVEKLLPEFYPLHSGLTTGTCATAAAVAATRRLLTGETPTEVPVILPNGETIPVAVGYADDYAYCIKEAGDDPDVTDGIEIRAYPHPLPKGRGLSSRKKVFSLSLGEGWGEVYAGEGIGRFTLPGFDYPPGEPAINRVPREMLRENISNLLRQIHKKPSSPFKGEIEGGRITLSVKDGEEIARRTFNPRLGIEGGISIIGVSGIVMPYSEEAFIESIHKCMEVAKASGSERVVIGSGMKSEQQLRSLYPELPRQAFVEYGNYIGKTLKMANELGFEKVTLGIMIGKAVKLAQGHLDTHSRRVTMDKAFVMQLLKEAHCCDEHIAKVQNITVARELWNILSPDEAERFSEVIVHHCYEHCKPLLPNGKLSIVLLRNDC